MENSNETAIGTEIKPFEYELLTDPLVRYQLFEDGLKLVEEIHDKKLSERPKFLFFLDRSARPSSWLFREIWETLAPDEPMPEIKYINIGKEKAPNFQGVYEAQAAQKRFISNLMQSPYVNELRQKFPHELKGGNIWVIDEWKQEGISTLIASTLLETAFLSQGGRIVIRYMHANEPPWLWQESWIGVFEDDSQDLFVHPLRNRPGHDRVKKSGHAPRYVENPNRSRQLRREIHQLVFDHVELI